MTDTTTPRPSQIEAINAFASKKLQALENKKLRRQLTPTLRGPHRHLREAHAYISFCDNDYLGLSMDQMVIDAGIKAARGHGAGAGAARLITGNNPLNHRVEGKLARLKHTEAALLFGSGFMANIGIIPVLAGADDLIIMDDLSHACLHAGARLSGANVQLFAHNDVGHAKSLLTQSTSTGRILMLTETVFSMDGDQAPLEALAALCDNFGAWLMTDDAHGFGVARLENPAPIQMGTLSKGAGVYGGYVCAPRALINLLTTRARSFIYTTGLPPFVLGAVEAAIDIIGQTPSLGAKAMENASLFCSLMKLPEPQSCIVPIILNEAEIALACSKSLEDAGFLVTAIRPPTVPAGTARLRFTFSAQHKQDDIHRLAKAAQTAIEKYSP